MSIVSLECINNLLKDTKIEKTKTNGNETIISTTNTSTIEMVTDKNGGKCVTISYLYGGQENYYFPPGKNIWTIRKLQN